MRWLTALLVLPLACGGGIHPEPPAPVDASSEAACVPIDLDASALSDTGTAPDGMASASCTASNYLDTDSFDVVASAIAACLGCRPTASCTPGAGSLSLRGLDQGVAPIVFTYGTAADGTHTLVGHGTPGVVPAPPGVVLEAVGIPAGIGLDVALLSFYVSAKPVFACAWK